MKGGRKAVSSSRAASRLVSASINPQSFFFLSPFLAELFCRSTIDALHLLGCEAWCPPDAAEAQTPQQPFLVALVHY